MQLYYIRHGQSANNLLWEMSGNAQDRSPDPELTELGRQQARLLAEHLSKAPAEAVQMDRRDGQNRTGFGITHIYSSLMVRAAETGSIVARRLGLPLIAWKELHEGGGIFVEDENTGERTGLSGMPRSFFEARFPNMALPDELDETGWWNRPAESREERPVRARRVLEELIRRHGQTDDRVAIVSHGEFWTHFIHALLEVPVSDRLWVSIHNASISRIDFREDEIALLYFNHAHYLPTEFISG